MDYLKCFCLGIVLLCMAACQQQVYELESLYFDDNYVQTMIYAHALYEDETQQADLVVFFRQNHKPLARQLLQTLHDYAAAPTQQIIDDYPLLLAALKDFHTSFPDYFSSTLVSDVHDLYRTTKHIFVSNALHSVTSNMSGNFYRKAHGTFQMLDSKNLLPTASVSLFSYLDAQLKRSVYIAPIKVHDLPIEQLISAYKQRPSHHYDAAASTLMEDRVNVPQEFDRHLQHHLAHNCSSYLDFQSTSANAHYALYVKVGIEKRIQVDTLRKTITETFFVQFHNDTQWVHQDLTYEIFVDQYAYHAAVDAELRLTSPNQVVGRYIFEAIAPQESITLGKFLDIDPDIVSIQDTPDYKTYKNPAISVQSSALIRKALDDSATVLSLKVLDTIDSDPDPWISENPPLVFQVP